MLGLLLKYCCIFNSYVFIFKRKQVTTLFFLTCDLLKPLAGYIADHKCKSAVCEGETQAGRMNRSVHEHLMFFVTPFHFVS